MPDYRVLVTGSRDWDNPPAVEHALNLVLTSMHETNRKRRRAGLSPYTFTLVHGACPTGADNIADGWAEDREEVKVERHPAQWNTHGRAAGPIRNKEMVDRGAVVVLGFPKGASRGTRNCLKLAEDAGLLVYVLEG